MGELNETKLPQNKQKERKLIKYINTPDGINPANLNGFFVGWPNPPSPETHLRLLRSSAHVILAQDSGSEQVVGRRASASGGPDAGGGLVPDSHDLGPDAGQHLPAGRYDEE